MDNIICINSVDTEVLRDKRNSLLKGITETYEISSLDLAETDCGTVFNELNTVPFLVEKRIIILRNVLLFNKNDDGKYVSTFLNYLENPNPTTILIIEIVEKVDARDKIFKNIKKRALYFNLKALDDKDLLSFTRESFVRDGYKIDSTIVSEIVKRSNNELSLLKESIEKLKIYKSDEKEISSSDINLLITRSVEDNVFDLVNAVLSRNVRKSYYIYFDLVSNNYDVLLLISLLLNKFNEIFIVKNLVESRVSKDEIMKTFKVSSGRAYYMIKDASRVSITTLKKQINMLNLLEYQIKSGQIDKFIGFEIYLTKI